MEDQEITQEVIPSLLRQPQKLPQQIHNLIDQNESVYLFLFSDLDESYKLQEQWLVLTNQSLYQFSKSEEKYELKAKINVDEVTQVELLSRLSSKALLIESDSQDIFVRCSLRQKDMIFYFYKSLKQALKTKVVQKPLVEADRIYEKALMGPLLDVQQNIRQSKTTTFYRLLGYLKSFKVSLAIGIGASIAVTLLSLLPPFLSGKIVDTIIKPFQDGNLRQEEARWLALQFVALLGGAYFVRNLFVWVRLRTMSLLGEKVAKKLRTELYAHIQSQNLSFFNKKQTGSIISRVSSDTDRIWEFIAFGIVEMGISFLMIFALSFVLISLDWKLGLMMVIPVPLILYANYRHSLHMRKVFLKIWRKWSQMTSVLSDTIPGIQVVKSFAQESYETKRFNKSNDVVTEQFNEAHLKWSSFWPVLMLTIHMTIVAVWFFSMPRVLSHPTEQGYLSIGVFVSFLLYMTMFSQPIEVIGQITRMMNRALSSAHRVFEILDTQPDFSWKQKEEKETKIKGEIEFKNVSFSYNGVQRVLSDVSFKIQPGEMIGLVGSSGGGKSTITKLMSRFYDVDAGEVLIDGQNVKNYNEKTLRSSMAMVLQEPFLFHGTIWQNIAYGNQKVNRGEVIKAAKAANAHEFILKLPLGYDTMVGERGHNLSGGERQRVSIARALLVDPKILILDEATSAVDTETERNIQEALDRLTAGRTVIAIAHRLSTLRKADRLFVIKEGEIVEQGTHSELAGRSQGLYKKLLEMQAEMDNSHIGV